MNMVSESDLPRPVSCPVLNAPAGPAREWQEVPIRRRGWSGGSMRSSFTTTSAGPGAT